MKKYTYVGVILMTILSACDSNLEKVHYDASDAQPAVLQSIDDSYVLDAQESSQTIIEFRWSKPVVNYPAAIITDLQMDLRENNFTQPTTLASTKVDSTYSITTGDLNASLRQLQTENGWNTVPLQVEFRLVSTLSVAAAPLVSNVVSSLITPYDTNQNIGME